MKYADWFKKRPNSWAVIYSNQSDLERYGQPRFSRQLAKVWLTTWGQYSLCRVPANNDRANIIDQRSSISIFSVWSWRRRAAALDWWCSHLGEWVCLFYLPSHTSLFFSLQWRHFSRWNSDWLLLVTAPKKCYHWNKVETKLLCRVFGRFLVCNIDCRNNYSCNSKQTLSPNIHAQNNTNKPLQLYVPTSN